MSAQTASKQLTRNSLNDAIQGVERSLNAWNAGEGPRIDWRGRNVKCLSERMIAVFGSLIELTATNNVAQDAKKTVLAIDDFATAMESWAENCQINPDDTNPAGDEEFWKTWKIVKLRIAERRRAVPRPISEYLQQNLNDRQIALQYHWIDALGEPDINKVQEEKSKPGTHFNPESWIHPLDVKDAEEIEVTWSGRSVKVAADQESKGVIPEAPESIYELLKQRVSSAQILRMKPNSTIEGIRAVAVKHDLEVDGVKVLGEDSQGSEVDIDSLKDNIRKDVDANLGAAPGVLPAALYDGDEQKRSYLFTAISELQESKKMPEEIVEAMTEDFPDLTVDHVAMIQTEIASASIAGL